MSVSEVMSTMMAADSPSSDVGSQPAGTTETGKPTVKGVEDIFNLYDSSMDESPAEKNGKDFEKDENLVPDELNNTVPKEVKKEEKKEEVKTEEIKPEVKVETPQTVKVKVNGVESEVPLQDVINSYSGQQEIQRRFTEFDKQKKSFEKERTELSGFNNYVKQEIGDLRSNIESMVGQYQKNGFMEKNPLDAVSNLLDKMGINSNIFERAVFEHQLPDYAKFFNMSDVERDAYYTKKENAYLLKKEQGFTERDQQVKLREEKQAKDFELIKNAGLDSIKYDELQKEMLDAGHENLTADKVVEYAKQKPTLDKVVEIFNQVGSDPTKDERARTVFKILSEFPDTTVEEILDNMMPDRAAIKAAQVLSAKAPKVNKVSGKKGEDADFDEMLSYFKN